MKDDLELKVLFDECIEHWGFEAQLAQLQEECLELALAISHLRRNKSKENNHGKIESVIEELADVLLMSREITHAIGQEKVIEVFDKKSDAVAEKLRKSKEKKYGN